MSDPAIPGEPSQPVGRPTDDEIRSEPLGENDVVIENEPGGIGDEALGGGEYPDPDTPPSESAPGGGSPKRGRGQFDEVYEHEAESDHHAG